MNATSSSIPHAQQTDTRPAGHPRRRALVLAGAGAAGNAWQLGLVAGVYDAGVDLTRTDLMIGTSAGSTGAAQLTSGVSPSALYAAVLAHPAPPPQLRGSGTGRGPAPRMSGPEYVAWSDRIIAAAEDAADMRRRIGAAALEMNSSDGAASARWHDICAARLPRHEWPHQRLLIPAVEAHTGEPVVFDRDSGVALVDAVAASTSAMTPYRIGGSRYINGGYRRSSNADLAAGCSRVLVLDPFGGRSRQPLEWGMDLATQVTGLRAGGSQVVTIFPDDGAGDVFNANALDPSTREPAARGGYAQGHGLAQQLARFWAGPS